MPTYRNGERIFSFVNDELYTATDWCATAPIAITEPDIDELLQDIRIASTNRLLQESFTRMQESTQSRVRRGPMPIQRGRISSSSFEATTVVADEQADTDVTRCCAYRCTTLVADDEPAWTPDDDGPYCTRHYDEACREARDRFNDDDDNYDEDDDSSSIHDYSYKPNPIFRSLMHPDGERFHVGENNDPLPLMMGFELEVECSNDGDRSESAVGLKNKLDGVGYLKSDGSLNYGFEIVTHPATLGWYMEKFPWKAISGLARQGFTAWNSSTCGLHIHISRASFQVNMEERNFDLATKREFTAIDDKHMWRFVYFIYRNKKEMVQFAGRDSNYASYNLESLIGRPSGHHYDSVTDRIVVTPPRDKMKLTLMGLIKGKSSPNGRSVAANMMNEHTIELRLFRPSLNPTTVKACLQFCEALFQYTKGLTIKQIMQEKALEFKAFHTYAMEHSVTYPELVSTIARRVYPDRTRNT